MKTRFFLLFTLLLAFSTTIFSQNDPIFYDVFDNASYGGWTVSNDYENQYSIYNGSYTIQHKTTTDRAYTVVDGPMVPDTDFEMSANVKHVAGETNYGVGLVFGGQDANNHYSFSVTYTGYFRLSKLDNGTYSNLIDWTANAAIATGSGSLNKLSIIRKDDYTYFYVNDKHVHSQYSLPLFGTQIGFDLYNIQTVSVDAIWVYGQKKTNNNVSKSEEVIFSDEFNDNSKAWADNMQSDADLYVRGGKYYFHHKRDESSWMTNQPITIDENRDYYIEASIHKVGGDENYGHGITWGRKDWENYYSFNIASTGFFRVSKEENDEWTNIKGWTESSAVKKSNGATNVLKIAKIGDQMKFYVNGVLVFETQYERAFGNRLGFEIHMRQEIAINYIKVAYTGSQNIVTRNTPPVIVITEPANTRDFNIVTATTVRIAGRAIDADGLSSVTVNGKAANFYSDGSFSTSISPTTSSDVTVIATDSKGLSETKTFKISVQQQNITDNNSNTTDSQKRLALVIGNGNYTGAGALKNPVNDARAMKTALEELGFSVIKYENCDQQMMKRAIDEFGRELANNDVGFFFYAGHGLQVKGANYLIPVDAQLQNENDVEYDCVRADRVMAKMEAANSKTNIVVLDACRNNPFERSWARSTNGNGLAFMNAPQGSLIAYATAPGNTASDGDGENGLYTSALLKQIRVPNASIETVFKKVRQEVIKSSEGKQTPWESTSLTGDFYFKK
jgi:hypothetical protein